MFKRYINSILNNKNIPFYKRILFSIVFAAGFIVGFIQSFIQNIFKK